jgi:hypothetical protein
MENAEEEMMPNLNLRHTYERQFYFLSHLGHPKFPTMLKMALKLCLKTLGEI